MARRPSMSGRKPGEGSDAREPRKATRGAQPRSQLKPLATYPDVRGVAAEGGATTGRGRVRPITAQHRPPFVCVASVPAGRQGNRHILILRRGLPCGTSSVPLSKSGLFYGGSIARAGPGRSRRTGTPGPRGKRLVRSPVRVIAGPSSRR